MTDPVVDLVVDEVSALMAAVLARSAEDGAPAPGDGFTLSCVPGAASGRDLRWELLVVHGGRVVQELTAPDPTAVLRTALGEAAPVGPSAAARGEGRGPRGPGDLLLDLERIADALPPQESVVDVDVVWDHAPGERAAAWAWSVSATRWDVLVEGAVLSWEGRSAHEALARAVAELDDAPGDRP